MTKSTFPSFVFLSTGSRKRRREEEDDFDYLSKKVAAIRERLPQKKQILDVTDSQDDLREKEDLRGKERKEGEGSQEDGDTQGEDATLSHLPNQSQETGPSHPQAPQATLQQFSGNFFSPLEQ